MTRSNICSKFYFAPVKEEYNWNEIWSSKTMAYMLKSYNAIPLEIKRILI